MSRTAAVPALGVLSPLVSGFYFGGLLDGIAQAAAESGFATVAFQSPARRRHRRRPAPSRRTGVMRGSAGRACPASSRSCTAPTTPPCCALHDAGKPLVLLSHEVPGPVRARSSMPDNAPGVREAVRHLIEHGHRDIAFAALDDASRTCASGTRRTGARLLEAGIEPDPRLLYDTGDTLDTGGRGGGAAMLAAGLPHTAVVAGTDLNAIGIIDRAVRRRPGAAAAPGDHRLRRHRGGRLRPAGALDRRPGLRQPRPPGGRPAASGRSTASTSSQGQHRFPTRFVRRQSCGCGHAELPVLGRPEPARPATLDPRPLSSARSPTALVQLQRDSGRPRRRRGRAARRARHLRRCASPRPSTPSDDDSSLRRAGCRAVADRPPHRRPRHGGRACCGPVPSSGWPSRRDPEPAARRYLVGSSSCCSRSSSRCRRSSGRDHFERRTQPAGVADHAVQRRHGPAAQPPAGADRARLARPYQGHSRRARACPSRHPRRR